MLIRENYHSTEMENRYMSQSQYLGFLECEARQMAILRGDYAKDVSDPLLVGQYVHAWNEGRRDQFMADHPDMFTKQGNLKATFQCGDKMIATLERDPFCMWMLEGQKEKVFTAHFAGCEWKILVDVHNAERGRMVDLKTTRSISEKGWSEELWARVSFVELYKYLLQAALYCEIERLASQRDKCLDFYVVAVSKENVPDKAIIDLRDPDRYVMELQTVQENMPRILAVKNGTEKAARCEKCDYCRSTKVLTGAVFYADL